MSDIHALSGAYAVDAIDDLERARFERHLDECEPCRSEVEGLAVSAALLADTTATPPPPALRSRLLADIQNVRPLPPVLANLTDAGRARRRRFPVMVAAAAVVGILGVGAAVVQPWDNESTTQEASPADLILKAADAKTVSTKLDDGSKIAVTRSLKLNRAVVRTTDLASLPDSLTYELWLIRDGDMVKAGLIRGGSTTVVLDGSAADADGAGITVEPAGGSSTPSDDVVALLNFEA